jgi:hypothetical protein
MIYGLANLCIEDQTSPGDEGCDSGTKVDGDAVKGGKQRCSSTAESSREEKAWSQTDKARLSLVTTVLGQRKDGQWALGGQAQVGQNVHGQWL